MINRTYRRGPLMTLMVTCLGFFMVLLDASIVNLALLTIQADLHAHLLDLQWVVDTYTLPLAVLLLTVGTLSDRYGRKRFFLARLALFLLGSSMINTSRQVGSTLGVAVLGAVVEQQFSGNIASQLTQWGVPGSISTTIASKIAGAGALASQIHLAGRLPLSQAALH